MKNASYTMTQDLKGNYFTLSRSPNTLKKFLLFLVKLPLLIPHWLLSIFVTTCTVNPIFAKKQRMINRIFLTDNPDELGLVVINAAPPIRFKVLKDFFLKAKRYLEILLPLQHRTLHDLSNKKDKAYVDQIIAEVRLLQEGKSTATNCKGKIFLSTDIHLKGIEHLNQDLRTYLYTELPELQDKKTGPDLHFYSLETPDGAVLDSVALSNPRHATTPFHLRKYIIACIPRDLNYLHWLKDFNYTVEHTQQPTTVIGFNYRGTDRSQGMLLSAHNMVNDALSQVRRLIALGVPIENISFEGTCIGASIATLATARLHEEGHHVKVYNERSIRSIRRFLVGFFYPTADDKAWHPMTWCKYFMVGVTYVIIAPALFLTNWRIDAAEAWNKIPQAYKDYTVFRNFNDPDPNTTKDDGIIEDSWSSIASLVDENRSKVLEKQTAGQALSEEEEAMLDDNPKKHCFKEIVGHTVKRTRKRKEPHFLLRQALQQSEVTPAKTMHDYMITSLGSQ